MINPEPKEKRPGSRCVRLPHFDSNWSHIFTYGFESGAVRSHWRIGRKILMLSLTKSLLLLSTTILVGCSSGCGRTGRTYTASESLPLAAGQRWTMQNQYGDFTYFQILARPTYQGCESGTFLDMYITKSAARAYWQAGIPGAWNHFILKNESGSWRNVTNTAGAETNPWLPAFETYQPTPIPGNPLPYFLLPPKMLIREGQKIAIDTEFRALTHVGTDLTPCMSLADVNNKATQCCSGIVEWHTTTEVRQVATPVYTGPAVATEFCEGNPCIYPETWYFAPGIGLVQISSEFPPEQNRPTLYTKRID